tara:strand:- start:338 stop:958 length:621 start_codon:yes stop_codon:yes gene_type:complete
MKNIKAIIFDLGGVILNINYQKTVDNFIKLGWKDASLFYSQKKQTSLFDQIETGSISDKEFILELKKKTTCNSIKDITTAWNSMLIDLPNNRLNIIKLLKNKYRIYLLSNTNSIHIEAFKKKIGDIKWEEFYNLFDKMYLSHEIGLRKPDSEIFNHIIEDQKLDAKNIFFIDDSIQHINTAKKLGIKVHHFKEEDKIANLFPGIAQ